jgi:hypothetical protein
MQSLQDPGELAAGCYPPTGRYANLEARGIIEMRSCRKGRHTPPVRMIKLAERQEITPYKWVHPDDDR